MYSAASDVYGRLLLSLRPPDDGRRMKGRGALLDSMQARP